jgi:hypothetical protein
MSDHQIYFGSNLHGGLRNFLLCVRRSRCANKISMLDIQVFRNENSYSLTHTYLFSMEMKKFSGNSQCNFRQHFMIYI